MLLLFLLLCLDRGFVLPERWVLRLLLLLLFRVARAELDRRRSTGELCAFGFDRGAEEAAAACLRRCTEERTLPEDVCSNKTGERSMASYNFERICFQ